MPLFTLSLQNYFKRQSLENKNYTGMKKYFNINILILNLTVKYFILMFCEEKRNIKMPLSAHFSNVYFYCHTFKKVLMLCCSAKWRVTYNGISF